MAERSDAEFEQAIDRLYALPLEEFTSARNALAKEARDEGERAIAARIKELRKPSVSAWAVNRLARERELDVQRLLKASEQLRVAQRDAVAGSDPGAFAAARRDEQQALARLGKAAREVLAKEGHGVAAIDRILRTLRAAATSDEGRELLKRGRLTDDLEPQGFEALGGIQPGRRKPRTDTSTQKQKIADARRRLRELQRQERSLRQEADAAEREASQAERRARELVQAAEEARGAAHEAEAAVAEAERELSRLA